MEYLLKKMDELWFRFANAKLYIDESSSIIFHKEVTSATKNYRKQEIYDDDKTLEKSVESYRSRNSQNENGASAGIFSTSSSDRKSKAIPRYRNTNHRLNVYGLWIIFLHNCLIAYASCRSIDPVSCALGLITPGRTWPRGDIVLEHGQPLKIYCILNEILTDPAFQSRNASDLAFFQNDTLVETKYITIINQTTIMMHVDQPSPSKNMYFCKLKLSEIRSGKRYASVCLNEVVIGFKPIVPRNFSCVSYNWDNLICTWIPAFNPIPTQFSLSFKLRGRAGGRVRYSCPRSYNNLPPNTCLWTSETSPIYRPVYENYTFVLNAENALGSDSFIYEFHHWAHVIPAEPVNLKVVDKTASSATLRWSIPFRMQSFPPGLYHRVSYQNERDPRETWRKIDITNQRHKSEVYFNLSDLQHANTVYTVRVSLKSSKAVDEDKWGKFSEIAFKTDPTVPGLAPKTDIGSYEIARSSDSRDVYIYWQRIPKYLENGDNFTYQVVCVEDNGRKLDIKPHEITKTYAHFKRMANSNLTFEIVATNCEGSKYDAATVRVSSPLEIPPKPVVFTKIAYDGGIYELSWNSSSHSEIVNYTVFWCENDRDRPYQCSGYLDWVIVPKDTRIYNLTMPDQNKIYQFAIAANTRHASSGMVWASSTTTLSNVVGKIKSVKIIRTESDQIEVGWELDYSGRIGIIEKFNIYHCPIVSAYNLTCDGQKMITTVTADPYVLHSVVRNLKPLTTYSITVALLTKNGEGLHSDALYITTLMPTLELFTENPRVVDTPSESKLVSSNVNEFSKLGPRTFISNDFVAEMKKFCNDTVDCKPNRTEKLNFDSTDCTTQLGILISSMSACEHKLNDLLDENRQLRQTLLKCNEIR